MGNEIARTLHGHMLDSDQSEIAQKGSIISREHINKHFLFSRVHSITNEAIMPHFQNIISFKNNAIKQN